MRDLEITVYDSDTLLAVLRDPKAMRPVPSYWLDVCFKRQVTFDSEWIDFGDLGDDVRKLAPLVVPTAQGKPIMSGAERRQRVKPAYVKPKDPITASRVFQTIAGQGELAGAVDCSKMTPRTRFQVEVSRILNAHNKAIRMRWEWMAAEAVLNGKVTLEDEAYPKTVVDFERDAAHTITLAPGSRWGDANVDIIDSLESMIQTVREARMGGAVDRITIGSKVMRVLRNDTKIRELMNLNYRNDLANGVNVYNGVMEGVSVEYAGTLGNGLPIYVYHDYYHDETGAKVNFMADTDIVLTGPNLVGVRAFGGIQDKKANFRAVPMFPKMWDNEDPSATFIMTQSAPLMVPVNPNATLRATVVA